MIDPNQLRAIEAISMAARLLTPHKDHLAALVASERFEDSRIHTTDPTPCRETASDDGFHQQIELAKAAIDFVATVQKVIAEIPVCDDAEVLADASS